MTNALVFFPQNLLPPKSGFHRRGLELLSAFHDLGVNITLASSHMAADWSTYSWSPESIAALHAQYGIEVRVHTPSATDRRTVRWLEHAYRRLKRRPPSSSRIMTPPGMRRWFAQVVDQVEPDLVLMNYVLWDGLIDHRRLRSVRRAIDIIDLVTLNQKMWQALMSKLPPLPLDPATVPDEIVSLDFFTRLDLEPDQEEFRICDRYDYTISITRQEREVIRTKTSRTQVVHIPMMQDVKDMSNTYAGPALFATGPNPFNLQAYLFFAKRVLPTILARTSDFSLQVTGYCCDKVIGARGIVLSGFVPDLAAAYGQARFAICPVFGLTGQQVKIVEAMAHGVPVVALKEAAARSPIEHEVNGLVAADAAEFAEHVVRLWSDRALCRRLGEAARETIRQSSSSQQLRAALAAML